MTAVEPVFQSSSAVVPPYAIGGPEQARRRAERSLITALEQIPASVPSKGAVTVNDPVAALVEVAATSI